MPTVGNRGRRLGRAAKSSDNGHDRLRRREQVFVSPAARDKLDADRQFISRVRGRHHKRGITGHVEGIEVMIDVSRFDELLVHRERRARCAVGKRRLAPASSWADA